MTPPKKVLPSSSELPLLPGAPIPSCPILLEAQIVLNKAHNLRKAVRHFARSTRRCLTCPASSSCPAMRDLDHQLHLALVQITRERGLDRD
jgi:hypothetical protein